MRIRELAPKRVVLITAVGSAVIMGDSMLYNVLPSHVDSFGISLGLVGVLLSANRLVRLASNSLAAWVLQRFGIAVPLLTSIVIAVGTTVVYGTVSMFGVLLLARILWGMTFSVFRLSGYLVVLDESHDTNRGRLMGFFSSGMRSGSIIGVLLGGLLFDVTGRTTSFLIIAAFGVLGLPAAWALVRGSHLKTRVVASSRNEPVHVETINYANNQPFQDRLRERVWDVLISGASSFDPQQRRLIVSASFAFFSIQLVMHGVLVSSLGFYLSQRLDSGITIAGILIGIATLNGALISTRWIAGLAAPYFGYLGDHYGKGKILAIALPICVAALLLLAFPVSIWWLVLWLPVSFMAVAASTVSLDSIVGGLAPVNGRAKVMSRYATWQDTGSAIGPLLAFAVLGFTSLTAVYLGGAILLAISLGWLLAVLYNYANRTAKASVDMKLTNE